MAVKRAAMVPPVQLSAVARVWMRSVRMRCTRFSGAWLLQAVSERMNAVAVESRILFIGASFIFR